MRRLIRTCPFTSVVMYDDRDDDSDETSLNNDDGGNEERVEDALPSVHGREEVDTAVGRLRETLNELDGSPMAVSNALIPLEAHDVGDVPIDANPRGAALADSDMACDNGYIEYSGCVVEKDERSGMYVMSDPPNWAVAGETHVSADEGSFIEDVTEWA